MSSKRVTIHRRRICAMGAGVVLLLGGWLPVATASPPDPPPGTAFAAGCPLQRIGTQLVRCDHLTGAGVRAPSWIPKLTSTAGDKGCPLHRIGTQLVRCDHLTGAGVRAPSWIPKLTSTAGDRRAPGQLLTTIGS